jgi:predicted lipase
MESEVSERFQVHSGMLAHPITALELLKQVDLKSHVLLCGHSLGGGVAVLLGRSMAILDPNKTVKVANFGSPRVGDGNFCDLYTHTRNLRVDRVVNPSDVITSLSYFGYYHVGYKYTLPPGSYAMSLGICGALEILAGLNWNP